MVLKPRRPSGPFAGRRILLLRGPETAGGLLARLREAGAEAQAVAPLVEGGASPRAQAELRAALQQARRFQALIFTSARAVQAVQAQWSALGLPLPWPEEGPDLASVGPATSLALEGALGRGADLEAPEGHARSLAAALLAAHPEPSRFLWPRNEAADGALVARLEAAGHQVLAPVAYAMVPAPAGPLAQALAWADGVVAYSAEGWRAAVAAWAEAAPEGKTPPWGVALGPSAAVAVAQGLGGLRATAQGPGEAALWAALVEAFRAPSG